MQKLCFDVYDKSSSQFITSSDLFAFFESSIFPLLKSDLFVMTNYLSNNIPIETISIKKSKYFKDSIEREDKKISFKVFTKLNFEQKFPDLLLALVYTFLGDEVTNFLCATYSIPKFKVTPTPYISVSRPINYYKDYNKISNFHYKLLKPDVLKFEKKDS